MSVQRRVDRRNEWWVDFRYRRKRIRKRSPVQTKRGAEQYERQLRQEFAEDETHGKNPFVEPPKFEEFVDRWMREYVGPRNRPAIHRDKLAAMRLHLLPAFGRLSLNEIDKARIDSFTADKVAAGLSPKTVNNILSVLHRCLRSGHDWQLLSKVPTIDWLRVPTQGYRYLNAYESERLLQHAPSRFWYTFALFLLRTGCRFGEAAALRWEDIALRSDEAFVHVRRSVNRGHVTATKTGRDRIVPLEPELATALAHLPRREEYVFARPLDGAFLKPDGTRRFLHRWCKQAGIDSKSWKDLRHTFATELTAQGVPLRAVQELLGHATIIMTSRYAHVAPSVLRQCVSLLTSRTFVRTSGHQMATKNQLPIGHDGKMVRGFRFAQQETDLQGSVSNWSG
jgi:integrase